MEGTASEIVVGLDIGTTKIVVIVGRKNEHGKMEVLGMGKSESIGVSRGVVSNIDKTVQSIRLAVEDAENKFWKLKVGESEYGPWKLKGEDFRIAAGNCNGGEVNYVLNPQ